MSRLSSFTTGKLYEEIIQRERRGDYGGGTVQIVPHLTDLIAEKITQAHETTHADIILIEIGGTVGDMENEHFLEAARRLRHTLGESSVQFVHVALLPFLQASKELKTKPIQHSIAMMRSYGISPDFLIVRADAPVPHDILEKLATASGIKRSHIIGSPTLDSIYRIPLTFHRESFGEKILDSLHLPCEKIAMHTWETLAKNIDASKTTLHIGIVGSYTTLEDASYSLNEGLKCAGFFRQHRVQLHFIDAQTLTDTSALNTLDGICISGGYDEPGEAGMILATRYAQTHGIPFLATGMGAQLIYKATQDTSALIPQKETIRLG